MGLTFLGGLRWVDVTRDERFFCQHLFTRIQQRGVERFVAYLNAAHATALHTAAEWEIAYEACFYRDLWQHRERSTALFSPKRTFDLCLLSDDAIVIIEAKAQQPFDGLQLAEFNNDKTQVTKETGIERVLLAGLASSRYVPPQDIRERFNGPYLTWREMAILYDNDPILLRADAIYEPPSMWQTGLHNTGGYMTGAELLAAALRGEEFFAGRAGGLAGQLVAEDIATGRWRQHHYETNRNALDPPNRNWFRLSEWMRMVSESSASPEAEQSD